MTNGINFEILQHIGLIGKYPDGWSKEINIVSWNGNPGKIDLRQWDQSHGKCSRGITLTDGELENLFDILADYLACKDGGK